MERDSGPLVARRPNDPGVTDAVAVAVAADDAGPGAPAEPAPHVLELRIHGVSNTPPAAMLEVDATDVDKVRGDSLGSFWELNPAALAHARGVPASHHDHVPDAVRREAYSWGSMARSSPSAPAGGARVWVERLSRAGWMFLVPLGLANAAYWSRRLSRDPARFSRGAGPIRLFGLGLTLLVVMAVQVVALDLVGTQCFTGGRPVCPSLPGFVASLQTFTWTQRVAVLSLAPVAAVLVLLWLSAGSRVRYEQPTSDAVREAPITPAPARSSRPRRSNRSSRSSRDDDESRHPWSLAHPDLWSRWGLTASLGSLHLAAGLALVTLTLAAADAWSGTPACRNLSDLVRRPACYLQPDAPTARPSVALFVLALLVLLGAAVLVWRAQYLTMPSSPSGGYRGATRAVLALALVGYLGELVTLWSADPAARPGSGGILGLSFGAGALVVGLGLLALVAPTWRAHRGWTWLASVGAASIGLALTARTLRWSAVEAQAAPLLVGGALLLVLAARPLGRRADRARPSGRSVEAWWGAAPAVFLVLSLGTVVMLTSLVVVAVGDWLNGSAPAQCLDERVADLQDRICALVPESVGAATATADAAGAVLPAGPLTRAELVLSPIYPVFSASTVMAVAVSVVLGVVALLAAVIARTVRRVRTGRVPQPVHEAAVGEPAEPLGADLRADHATVQPAGALADLLGRSDLRETRRRVRRLAAWAQRAELVLLVLALGFLAALVLTIWLSSVRGDSPAEVLGDGDWVPPLTSVGLWSTAILWGTVVLRTVTQRSSERPLGLLWDLMCFLPRSAHPFGPPCYAERVVPEVAGRIRRWLDDAPASDGDPRRRVVVLSAHSLGAVLAVAALFTQPEDRLRGRVGLLTYGTQLRPYFGRFFPELLGPDVLGAVGCPPASALDCAPWPPTPPTPGVDDALALAHPGSGSLVTRLGGDAATATPPAWVSLWRSTDPLGMPVISDAPNQVDRAAEELDATAFVATVATHGGYPRTTAYRRAFREVLDRVSRHDPAPRT